MRFSTDRSGRRGARVVGTLATPGFSPEVRDIVTAAHEQALKLGGQARFTDSAGGAVKAAQISAAATGAPVGRGHLLAGLLDGQVGAGGRGHDTRAGIVIR